MSTNKVHFLFVYFWYTISTQFLHLLSCTLPVMYISYGIIPYSGKLSREKTFVNFVVLWLYAKVFSVKFEAWHPLALQKRAIRESILRENRIFTNSQKFSPSKVSRYMIVPHLLERWLYNNCMWLPAGTTTTIRTSTLLQR